jgi:hypothetical protein
LFGLTFLWSKPAAEPDSHAQHGHRAFGSLARPQSPQAISAGLDADQPKKILKSIRATPQERKEAERRIRYVREVNAIKDYHWDEGRAQGKAEATKDLLIRMLELKFGSLSPEHQVQLNSASPVQLEAYFDAALTASTAREVFAR